MNFEIKNILNTIYNNKELNKFICDNNLTDKTVEKYLVQFMSFINSEAKCAKCLGLDKCTQCYKGQKVNVRLVANLVENYFIPCQKELNNQKIKNGKLITVGCNIDEVVDSEIDLTKERTTILTRIKKIYNEYKEDNTNKVKGLYIYGPHGTGKSFLIAKCAVELKKLGYDVIYAYYPELVRLIKSSISTPKFDNLIEELKAIDVLMLDDFGAESDSQFIRDEVLSSILQERMEYNRLTFMTSNLVDESLIEHLSRTDNKADKVKATRIRARIQALMDMVELKGINYRK